MPKIEKLFLFVAAIVVVICGSAWAHSVAVFAWVEGDTVHVEGKFGGGRRTVNATVEVYDPDRNLMLTGATDDKGEFSFKAPRKTEMKVVLQAGMGHRGEWTIPLSDFEAPGSSGASEAAASGTQTTIASGPEPATEIVVAEGLSRATSDYVTVEEMQEAVEAALDKKLQPVMKLLLDANRSGPGVSDILGGIGYIFGLTGVAAYVASRRKKPDTAAR